MTDVRHAAAQPGSEHAPPQGIGRQVAGYAAGLVLAAGLTATSFFILHNPLIWAPGVAYGLIVLAIAQMGVHLVFFLHLNTGPDSTNTVLALAFGLLITFLIMAGSLFIMSHLNHMMPAMSDVMRMQR